MDITKTPSTYLHEICTDASLQGYSSTYRRHYIQSAYPEIWSINPIHILELYPIFLLIAMFSRNFRDSFVNEWCGNQAVVAIINNLTANESVVLGLLRRIVLILMKNNIIIQTPHIPGVDNKLCDALSRHTASADLLKQFYMDDRSNNI